jgi:ankyrin repeat protein
MENTRIKMKNYIKRIIITLSFIYIVSPLPAMERRLKEPFAFEQLPPDLQRNMYSYFVRPQDPSIQRAQAAINNIIAASAQKRIADIRSFLQTRRKYYQDEALNQFFISQIATAYNQNPLEVALQLQTQGATTWLKKYLMSNLSNMNQGIRMYLHAAESANLGTFMGLTKAGLTAQINDQMGNSPLLFLSRRIVPSGSENYIDSQRKQQQIAAWLLTHGASPNFATAGEYPLLEAARNDNTDLILLLLQNGADPNISGQDGSTPLLWAVSYNNLPVVQALLAKGIPKQMINKPNNLGNTPEQVAHKKRYTEISKLLKKFSGKQSTHRP